MENEDEVILFEAILRVDTKTNQHSIDGGFLLEHLPKCSTVGLLPILVEFAHFLNVMGAGALNISSEILKGIANVEERVPDEIKEKMNDLKMECHKAMKKGKSDH